MASGFGANGPRKTSHLWVRVLDPRGPGVPGAPGFYPGTMANGPSQAFEAELRALRTRFVRGLKKLQKAQEHGRQLSSQQNSMLHKPPKRLFVFIVSLWGDSSATERRTNKRPRGDASAEDPPAIHAAYVHGVHSLAESLPSGWTLWVLVTPLIYAHYGERLLARHANLHLIVLEGTSTDERASPAGGTLVATLARFVLLDDPRIACAIVVDADLQKEEKKWVTGLAKANPQRGRDHQVEQGIAAEFLAVARYGLSESAHFVVHEYTTNDRIATKAARVLEEGRSWNAGCLVQVLLSLPRRPPYPPCLSYPRASVAAAPARQRHIVGCGCAILPVRRGPGRLQVFIRHGRALPAKRAFPACAPGWRCVGVCARRCHCSPGAVKENQACDGCRRLLRRQAEAALLPSSRVRAELTPPPLRPSPPESPTPRHRLHMGHGGVQSGDYASKLHRALATAPASDFVALRKLHNLWTKPSVSTLNLAWLPPVTTAHQRA